MNTYHRKISFFLIVKQVSTIPICQTYQFVWGQQYQCHVIYYPIIRIENPSQIYSFEFLVGIHAPIRMDESVYDHIFSNYYPGAFTTYLQVEGVA
jgi:hypothetical protein